MTDTNAERVHDLDETRRLLYMALAAPYTKRYNLAGTLINALCHHEARIDMDLDELIGKVTRAVDGNGDTAWVKAQIDRITQELDPARADEPTA